MSGLGSLFGGGGDGGSSTTVSATQNTYAPQGDNGVQGNRSGNTTLKQSSTNKVTGDGNLTLGTGATYVESLDGELADAALNLNANLAALVVNGAQAQTGRLVDALADQADKNQSFSSGLVGDFQNLAESSQLLARDTLKTVLNSEKFATPEATTGNLFGSRFSTLALVGAGLVGLWLWRRRA